MRFNLRICLIVSTVSRPNRLRDFTKIRSIFSSAIFKQLLIAGAMIHPQARGGIIVNSDKPPIRISLDIFGVKLDLIFQTALLFLMARAAPAVSRHPELLDPDRYQSFTLWYLNDISRHDKTSMFSTHVFMSSITWRFLQKEKLPFSLVYKAKM